MICNHNWVGTNIHGYKQCKICLTYTLENEVNTGVYSNDYWNPANGRSTLDEQVHNLNFVHNGASKVDKVMAYVSGGNKALEIGCAPGNMLQKLADTHTMAFGIEVDPKNFPDIKRIADRDNTRLWEGFFPYDFFGLRDSTFDTIVAMDVLEHADDPEWFVAHCANILSPTGRLIVMTPVIQPDVAMPDRMWNTEEHIWVFSHMHIMGIFNHYFSDVRTDSWHPGHEMVIGTNKRRN